MAQAKLSSKVKQQLDRLALSSLQPNNKVALYKETSISGLSETLRYRHIWIEEYRGRRQRSESGMILSVTIHALENGADDPKDLKRFDELVDLAQKYFDQKTKALTQI